MSNVIEVKVPDIGDFKDIPVIEVLVKPGEREARKTRSSRSSPTRRRWKCRRRRPAWSRNSRSKSATRSRRLAHPHARTEAERRRRKRKPPAAPEPACGARTPAPKRRRKQPPRLPSGNAAHALYRGRRATCTRKCWCSGGSRRLYRRVSRGRPRQASGAGRALSDARRRLPERRLHTVQSAAARRQSPDRSRGSCARGHRVRQSRRSSLDKLRAWKSGVLGKLTKGLAGLAKQRKVEVVQGRAQFASPNTMRVETPQGAKTVVLRSLHHRGRFERREDPGFPYDDKRIFDSTGALELPEIPKRLLVIGGGIIGLEMATVTTRWARRSRWSSSWTRSFPGADQDIVRPLAKRIEKRYEKILLKTKVAKTRGAARRPEGPLSKAKTRRGRRSTTTS